MPHHCIAPSAAEGSTYRRCPGPAVNRPAIYALYDRDPEREERDERGWEEGGLLGARGGRGGAQGGEEREERGGGEGGVDGDEDDSGVGIDTVLCVTIANGVKD